MRKLVVMKKIAPLIILLSATLAKAAGIGVRATDLRTEHRREPMDIGTTRPRLGWRIEATGDDVRQTSYEIIVSSTRAKAESCEGDLWATKEESGAMQWIDYGGRQLHADERCYWRVRLTTNHGETEWSEVATWNVGLLTEGDWRGDWIGWDHAEAGDVEDVHSQLASRYMRKEFSAKKDVRRATMYVSGLGQYEAYMNGERVGDQVLAPSPTDYRRTALYNAYDVTRLVMAGETNAVGVVLGCGRYYTMQQKKKPYKIANFGYPRVRMNIIVEYGDGSSEVIITDAGWRMTTEGPIRKGNEYDGETYDARKELGEWTRAGYDDTGWHEPERVAAPYGTLRPQMTDGMKILSHQSPTSETRQDAKTKTIDFGENMAGWVTFNVRGLQAGDTVRVRYAERTDSAGRIWVENLRNAQSTDTYIASGRDATYRPTFTYHGFRYVEITCSRDVDGHVVDIAAEKVSDAMERTGSFWCDNAVLNSVYENAVRGIIANYKGMPVDCPQRDERQPWLGDRTMGSHGESYVVDCHDLYVKWMRDIAESQREDGCIPDVAPAYWNYYTDNVTWPAAMPMTLMMLTERFDDAEPMEHYYKNVALWLRHIGERYKKDGLIARDKYGDWCVPPEDEKLIHSQDPKRKTDGTLISTAYYIMLCERMAELASDARERKEFAIEAMETRKMFLKAYIHEGRGTSKVPGHLLYPDSTYFGNNTVTANLLGLMVLGESDLTAQEVYVRDEARKNILRNILTDNKEHISCGVIGISWLLKSLAAMGRNDVAWRLATQDSYPSWGYMAKKGATTTWELWNGDTASPKMNSGNHVMLLGDLLPWIYEELVGIRSTSGGHIELSPDFGVDEIGEIRGSFKSIYGTIRSEWKKKNGQLQWRIEIPAGTTAEAIMPDGTMRTLTSGTHDLTAELPKRDASIVVSEFVYGGQRDAEGTTPFESQEAVVEPRGEGPFLECHSASIAENRRGDLVATYFAGVKERTPDCSIYVSIKKKGSNEWSAPILAGDGVFVLGTEDAARAGIEDTTTLAGEGPVKARRSDKAFRKADASRMRRKACWNPVLMQEPGGDMVLYYKIGLKVSDWTAWVVRSRDGGKTWGDREYLGDSLLGPVKNKIMANAGRLIAPTSLESHGWHLYFELSDDGGKTWRKTPFVEADTTILAIQPALLRLGGANIAAVARTRNRQVAYTESHDNGETWSKIELLSMPNNNSGLDAVTTRDGRHVMICNDWPIEPDKQKGARTPLSLMTSDDGKTWTHWMTLEDSPISQYSYPSIIETSDGHLHCIYTWRRRRIKHVEIK